MAQQFVYVVSWHVDLDDAGEENTINGVFTTEALARAWVGDKLCYGPSDADFEDYTGWDSCYRIDKEELNPRKGNECLID